MIRSLALALILLTIPFGAARAWNAAGHMTVAKLAWDQLDAKDRMTLYELLQNHPHWKRYFAAHEPPKGTSEMDFRIGLASTWADWLRGYAKATDAEGKKIYLFHKGPRHYVNWPLVHPEDVELFKGKDLPIDPKDDIVRGMKTVIEELKAKDKFSPAYRAVSLCWLFHLVGDVHQPLHNIGFYAAEIPTGDQGGNLFWVKHDGEPVRLHTYWDDLFGREDFDAHAKSYERAIAANAQLTRAEYDRSKYAEELKETDLLAWSKQGYRIAADVGYRGGRLPGRIIIREFETETEKAKAPALPDDYHAAAMAAANRQAALAGYRLAGLLREIAAATRGD